MMRNLISQRTREALARKKAEGVILGRPKGAKSRVRKLTGRDADISALLSKGVSKCAIARIMGVHRLTVSNYCGSIGPPDYKDAEISEELLKKTQRRESGKNNEIRSTKSENTLRQRYDG